MTDEHRERLLRRLTPIHLYKLTPKTNCGECGFATCLAFATQVIVGQGDLESCRYLDPEALAPFRRQLAEQHEAGIGVRREGFEKALQFLREEIKKWDLAMVAASLGASYRGDAGQPLLELRYFDRQVTVTDDDATAQTGAELSPWEKILLFNYVISGATDPAGEWVGMQSLPNSVSKIKSLKAHCEDKLATTFAGKMKQLDPVVARWGAKITEEVEGADFAAEFPILPRVAVRILWWDEDPAEGFAPRVKFLFDANVLGSLDLESLLFACEQLTDRLVESGS